MEAYHPAHLPAVMFANKKTAFPLGLVRLSFLVIFYLQTITAQLNRLDTIIHAKKQTFSIGLQNFIKLPEQAVRQDYSGSFSSEAEIFIPRNSPDTYHLKLQNARHRHARPHSLNFPVCLMALICCYKMAQSRSGIP
ncbi:MAG: hypothetical protein KKG35_16710 [Proteobacteria bacterium]|nr:hypothetical protein [Pseudomonadota bacterium]